METRTIDKTLSFLPRQSLWICRSCAYGVRRRDLRAHLRKQHRYTPEALHTTLTRCEQEDENWSGKEVVPVFVAAPLPLIPTYEDGLLCLNDPAQCSYICRRVHVMRRHCRQQHQISQFPAKGRPLSSVRSQGPASLLWRVVRCQRLYLSREDSGFFEVRGSSVASVEASESRLATVNAQMDALRTQAYALTWDTVDAGDHTEISPWVRRTGWATYLADCQRSRLRELIQPPTAQSASWEHAFWTAMHETAQLCEQTVRTEAGHFLRTEIMQTESSQRSKQVLQPYQREDLTRFVRPWQEIVIFLLRTMSEEGEQRPSYRLLAPQRRALEALRAAAETSSTPQARIKRGEESKFSPLHGCCLRVCLQLLDQSVRTREYESPLICALAVLGVTERGFKTPQQYTSLLSSMIKLSRYFAVRAALHGIAADSLASTSPSSADDSDASDALDDSRFSPASDCKRSSALSRLEGMSQRFLMRGTHSPMEWMLDLRSYGMKIVFNTTQDGRMEWNGDLVLYREIQFTMAEFRTWVHGLLHEAQALCVNELLLQRTARAPIPSVDWDSLRDDPSNSSVGWNFLQDRRSRWPLDGDTWLWQLSQQTAVLRPIFWPERARGAAPPKSALAYHEWLIESYVGFHCLLVPILHMSAGISQSGG